MSALRPLAASSSVSLRPPHPVELTQEEMAEIAWAAFKGDWRAPLLLDGLEASAQGALRRAKRKREALFARRLRKNRSVGFLVEQIATRCGEAALKGSEEWAEAFVDGLIEERREQYPMARGGDLAKADDFLRAWVREARYHGVPTRWTDARCEVPGEWSVGQPRVIPSIHTFPKATSGHDMVGSRVGETAVGWMRGF